jgi:hypothetical protein
MLSPVNGEGRFSYRITESVLVPIRLRLPLLCLGVCTGSDGCYGEASVGFVFDFGRSNSRRPRKQHKLRWKEWRLRKGK